MSHWTVSAQRSSLTVIVSMIRALFFLVSATSPCTTSSSSWAHSSFCSEA